MTFSIFGNKPRAASLELICFSKLPVGAWFYYDANGAPGLALSKKVSEKGSLAGNLFRMIETMDVWWVKGHVEQQYL